MQHRYSVKLTYRARRGLFPAMRGEIYEGDVRIGQFSRAATVDGYVPPFQYRFFSERSQARFDDFADCLSIGETIEALIPHTAEAV